MTQTSAASPTLSPLLVLDLDGTLVDTAPDLVGALNAVLKHDGFEPVPSSAVGTLVGRGARLMFLRALEFHGCTASEPHVDRLVEAFVEHYAANIAIESRPFPGVISALDLFQSEGWSLAVCTNKLEYLAVKLLDELDLLSRMSVVCGGDTFSVSKPDPRHLTGTIMRAGADANRAIMVGDSETDIRTAQAAEIPVIAVDFGYSDQPVTVFDPDCVVSSFDTVFENAVTLLERTI